MDLQNCLLGPTVDSREIWRLLFCRSSQSRRCTRPAVSPRRRLALGVSSLAVVAAALGFPSIRPYQPQEFPDSPNPRRCAERTGRYLGSAPALTFLIPRG